VAPERGGKTDVAALSFSSQKLEREESCRLIIFKSAYFV